MSGGLMSGGRMSGGRMSGGRLSGGLMSGGLMSAHRFGNVRLCGQGCGLTGHRCSRWRALAIAGCVYTAVAVQIFCAGLEQFSKLCHEILLELV